MAGGYEAVNIREWLLVIEDHNKHESVPFMKCLRAIKPVIAKKRGRTNTASSGTCRLPETTGAIYKSDA